MEFGIFSNGFRPHVSAAHSYDEDIAEIVLADRLGFRDAYISEHHGEPPYIGTVDTIPLPELMMCKAAALTKSIRMGSAVKLIHLHHPVDVAIQAAVANHLVGAGRFIFGFGSGFAAPMMSEGRGLSFEDRHARLAESLEAVLKCWSTEEPFDWNGRFWRGSGIVALPKPPDVANMPMATATSSDSMIRLAAERGYILLSAFLESAAIVRARGETYTAHAIAAGRDRPRNKLTVARLVYMADSREEAIEDLREAVAYEVSIQAKRGFLTMLKNQMNLEVPNDERAIDYLTDANVYMLGTPEEVTRKLEAFYEETGGFGTLLITTGKDWATREKRHRSMRLFMEQVAPRLRHLQPHAAVAA
ncbi:LLM class flavin-dependent oxidoreductase [Roseomonas chloroacetimidivorans]|uniref:LLM class flavin-dependent oxidoreductase n=1 Tax=Roseomonas chloroacetimidivorans TaxID=1766656 RepID=UPI003C795A3F